MLKGTGPASSEPERWVGVQSRLAHLLLFPQIKILDLNQRDRRMNLAGPRNDRVREKLFFWLGVSAETIFTMCSPPGRF